MQTSPALEDINHLDLEAIERQARIMRAQVVRSWFVAVESRFSGRSDVVSGRAVQA